MRINSNIFETEGLVRIIIMVATQSTEKSYQSQDYIEYNEVHQIAQTLTHTS